MDAHEADMQKALSETLEDVNKGDVMGVLTIVMRRNGVVTHRAGYLDSPGVKLALFGACHLVLAKVCSATPSLPPEKVEE